MTRLQDRLEDQVFSWLDYQPALIADPYPLYQRMRAEAPVFRYLDRVFVSQYADVREVLVDEVDRDLRVLRGAAGWHQR